jgi:hypothetical protein
MMVPSANLVPMTVPKIASNLKTIPIAPLATVASFAAEGLKNLKPEKIRTTIMKDAVPRSTRILVRVSTG